MHMFHDALVSFAGRRGISMKKEDTVALKAIAIIYVLLGHLNYLDSSGAWGVHIFLIVSGYGLETSYQWNGLKDYWKKRFTRVFVPYEAILLLALSIEMFINKKCSIINAVISMAGLDLGYNIDPSMWYISYCFLLYAEFYLWKKVLDVNVALKYILPFLFVILNFFLAILDKTGWGMIWSATAQTWIYTIDFYVGIALAHKKEPNRIALYSIVFVSTAYFVMRYGQIHYKADLVLFSLSAAALTIFLVIKLKLGKYIIIQKLGVISLYVYLIEGHFLRWKGYLLGASHSSIANVLAFELCLLGGYVAWKITNVLRKRVGGGNSK